MNAQAIMTVAGAVVILTQIIKGMGLPNQRAPIVVLGLSALGVVFWGISAGNFDKSQLFGYFAGWISVAFSAAGVWGYVRSTPAALTSGKTSDDSGRE
jgi:hypothetical protein